MNSSTAASMSQLLGRFAPVNSEKVRWYVGEYLTDRVVRFASESATSGVRPWGRCSVEKAVVDKRYEMIACSSAKVDRSCVAM
jgi:hypothetical protein